MNDHVVGVDQDPVGRWQTFDARRAADAILDPLGKLGGHRRHLPRRAARSDHHMVGDARFARQRDGDDLDRLVVVERLEDETMEVFDVDYRTAVAGGPVNRTIWGTIGQVVS